MATHEEVRHVFGCSPGDHIEHNSTGLHGTAYKLCVRDGNILEATILIHGEPEHFLLEVSCSLVTLSKYDYPIINDDDESIFNLFGFNIGDEVEHITTKFKGFITQLHLREAAALEATVTSYERKNGIQSMIFALSNLELI